MEISFLSLSYTQAHISQFLELNFILNEYNYKISNIFTESMLKKKKKFYFRHSRADQTTNWSYWFLKYVSETFITNF